MDRDNGPTSGLTSITVFGSNFGAVDVANQDPSGTKEIRIGGSLVAASTYTSDSSILIRVPCGAGTSKTIDISVFQSTQDGSLTQSFTYDGPSIASLNPNRASTNGGGTITIGGANFGTCPDSDTTVEFEGDSSYCGSGYCARTIVAGSYAYGSVQFTVPEGTGIAKNVRVHVSGQTAEISSGFTYSNPTVTR